MNPLRKKVKQVHFAGDRWDNAKAIVTMGDYSAKDWGRHATLFTFWTETANGPRKKVFTWRVL